MTQRTNAKKATVLAVASLLVAPGFAALPVAPADGATIEIADGDADNVLAIGDVGRRGDMVVGTLTNRGADEIRDIRLLIDVAFLWANEVQPGADSPGRSAVMTVAGPIAPHGKVAFEFTPNPPLPERTDGRYADPKVRVMGYQTITAR